MGVEVSAEVGVQLLVAAGGEVGGRGGEKKTKSMLYSTQLKLKSLGCIAMSTILRLKLLGIDH